jgi:LysM domain-containing protein
MSQHNRPTPRSARGLLFGLLLVTAWTTSVWAETVRLNPDAPDEYVVQQGDTLWDISGMFLQDPWMWPEIWQVNPEIANPHLIYPGDVIRLIWIDGEPQLVVNQEVGAEPEPVAQEAAMQTVRMSPQIRVLPLDASVDPIPWDAIGPFLSRPSVVDRDELLDAPYVLSTQESHLMAGSGDDVYVRGTDAGEGTGYRIVKLGQRYEDPESGDLLGYEAIYVGEGFVLRPGDPTVLRISSADREVLEGNRLLPASQDDLDRAFQPHPPSVPLAGFVIAVVDGIASVGRYQIVVLNLGSEAGVTQGDVLAIHQTNQEVEDAYQNAGRWWRGGLFNEDVALPDVRAGELMVFRVNRNISYALITRSDRDIGIGDAVRNP